MTPRETPTPTSTTTTTTMAQTLERWLAPQVRFDRILADAMRLFPRGLCDLAYANSWDGPPAEVRQALAQSVAAGRGLDLQYTPYGGSTLARRHVARWLDRTHAQDGTRHAPSDVVLTPGAMSALNVAFRQATEGPGDEVLCLTPCWIDYPLYLAQLGLTPKLVPLTLGTLEFDLDAIAAAITPRTKALVFSQPSNPSGRVFSDEELIALARLLEPHEVTLIADECHRAISPIAVPVPAQHYAKTLSVYSFGKRLFLQGQRLGFVAVHPQHPARDAARESLVTWVRAMGFCTPTALMQRALPTLLTLEPDLAPMHTRHRMAVAALENAGYRVPQSDATFFMYPEVPAGEEDEAFVTRAASRGLLVLPASVFHHRGHFRLSTTGTQAMLEQGLDILTALIQEAP